MLVGTYLLEGFSCKYVDPLCHLGSVEYFLCSLAATVEACLFLKHCVIFTSPEQMF